MNTQQQVVEIESYPINSKVRIDKSPIHFRGVFATEKINSGDLIERCPLVPMANRSRYQGDQSVWDYMYGNTNCECQECKNHGFVFYMVLGYGMIYNHKDVPNSVWVFHYDKLYADLVASKDIEHLEEIFVSYGPSYWHHRQKKENDAKDSQ